MEKQVALRMLVAAAVSVMVSFSVAGATLAAKPSDVMGWSNGFPSGEHYNLNIHGKKSGFDCEGKEGGGSMFVPEYGDSQIEFIQNKKKNSDVDDLTILDACAGFDGDAARAQLPAGEYQVYARILAKPSKTDEPREVVFHPSLVEACNDSGTENFTDATTCDESFLMGLGVVTKDGAFDTDGESFERSDDEDAKGGKGNGKGKSKAEDISDMFKWSGWACDQAFDTDGDGEITTADLEGTDLNEDGVVDEADLELYLEANCTWFDSQWVFDIADLVVSGWDYKNNGSKLLQVRFYPVDSTTFE